METLAIRGGIIGFHIDWHCNLDHGLEACVPSYSFRRLDNSNDKIAKGWNFRHAYYFNDGSGVNHRDVIKYWGIRFVFLVGGQAGKFSLVDFALHLGSSLGLLGLASAMCEIVLSYYASKEVQRLKMERVDEIKQGKDCRPSKLSSPSYSADLLSGHLVSLQNGTGYRYRKDSISTDSVHNTVVTPISQRHLLTAHASSKSLHSNSLHAVRNETIILPVWL
ncbi:hypothetical protein RvY_06346-2 [Ramazzottius varieornatus]|uniref:Uncharacterized protein n=1 Tax=Ramazzottius varieornatus TaxID=947166 RepID=A0A1D1UY75_RAMVA|nr:hypothetical protein RvY_06346-2 [Ramazzottius varieornatus]